MTEAQFKDFLSVSKNILNFAHRVKVTHPLRGKVPFYLYNYQKMVLYKFLSERFNIVLKFRQAGLTELIALFVLWLAMYHNNKTIILISIKMPVAKRFLRRIKNMYTSLDAHLRLPVVNGRGNEIGTSTEMEFSNGSIIISIPTTEDAGRSEAVSLMVIDEAAIVRWANQIWAAALPTLSTGGSAILNSTPYGIGNFYHKVWVNSLSGGNKFNPIRLRWQMHPDRDIAWYNEMREALGPRRTAQEIDGDFLTSGYNVFDLVDIRAIEDELNDHEQIDPRSVLLPDGNGQVKLFGLPKLGQRYYIGADISTGRANDYSSFTLMDSKGEEWAVFKGKLPPKDMADLLAAYGKKFNNALLAPESNDIGLATTSHLEENGYPNLYYSTALVKNKKTKKKEEKPIPGWYTTKSNRPVMISGLEEDVRLGNVIIKDPYFVDEAYTFIYDDRNRPVAMGKGNRKEDEEMYDEETYTDDDILGKAIANHIRKGSFRRSLTLPT